MERRGPSDLGRPAFSEHATGCEAPEPPGHRLPAAACLPERTHPSTVTSRGHHVTVGWQERCFDLRRPTIWTASQVASLGPEEVPPSKLRVDAFGLELHSRSPVASAAAIVASSWRRSARPEAKSSSTATRESVPKS